jgi:tetratricopeptide (TPR) repeat protein
MTRSRKVSRQRPGTPNTHHSKHTTVALCVIAKNEEEFIANCLDSARPFVDEMIVVDTGSTDRTVEIAREHGARVEHFEWCDDFAAARNTAIEAATADWILMLDADEELEAASGPLLRPIADLLPADFIGFSISVANLHRTGNGEEAITHNVTRYFPRRESLRYRGVIHEDLYDLEKQAYSQVIRTNEIRVRHYGYDPTVYKLRSKDTRNMQLLQAALEREPDNVRLLYYLGQQSSVGKRYVEACRWFEQLAERAAELPPHIVVDAYQIWLAALERLGDIEGLERVGQRGEEAGTLSALSREILAKHELERGHPGFALRHVMAALSPDVPFGVTLPEGIGGWRTWITLAQVYEALGEPDQALHAVEQSYAQVLASKRVELATQSAALALRHGRRAAAGVWFERAAEAAPDDVQTHLRALDFKVTALRDDIRWQNGPDAFGGLDQALAGSDWQAAYDLAMGMSLGQTNALARVLFLSGKLREQGAPEAALDVLGRALDAYPTSAHLYWTLIQSLTDVQRVDDALQALEILRSLPDGETLLQIT